MVDPQGAIIPGVTVTATNQATGLEKSAATALMVLIELFSCLQAPIQS
ncbi:MAG TPA: carboxypeptidase-like regulatory domain-containing protein [Pyrinomonadaceae bacterium]|nr:carboxypeptidase-like regulatory domain-containing protein [Pyrinomonadaceae bacterium]